MNPALASPLRMWRAPTIDDLATDATGTSEKRGLRRLVQPPSSPITRSPFSKSTSSDGSPARSTSFSQEQSRMPLSILSKTVDSPVRGTKRSWRTRVMGKVRLGATTSSSNATSSDLGDDGSSPTATVSTAASIQDSHAAHQLRYDLEEEQDQIIVVEQTQAKEMDDMRHNSSSVAATIGGLHRTDRLDPRSFLPRVRSSRKKKPATPERKHWSFHEKKKPASSIEIPEDGPEEYDKNNSAPQHDSILMDPEDSKFENREGEMLNRKEKKKQIFDQPKRKGETKEHEREHLREEQHEDISNEHNVGDDDKTGIVSTVEIDTEDFKGILFSHASNFSTAPCDSPSSKWLEDETVHLVCEEEDPEASRDGLNVETSAPPSDELAVHEPTPMSEVATPRPTTPVTTAEVSVDVILQRLDGTEDWEHTYREKLERTQDLVANQFRDLAQARRSGQALVNRNLFLMGKLKQVMADQEENMIARSSLLKACLIVSPIFVLCGGVEIFLSTIVLVWILVEIEATWLSDGQTTLGIDDGDEDEDPGDKRRVREALKRHRRTKKKHRPQPVPKNTPIPTDIVLSSKRKGD